jgi:hypothetical protein
MALVTEFERRQMVAVRKELDEEYEAAVGLNIQPSKAAARQKYPATFSLDRPREFQGHSLGPKSPRAEPTPVGFHNPNGYCCRAC